MVVCSWIRRHMASGYFPFCDVGSWWLLGDQRWYSVISSSFISWILFVKRNFSSILRFPSVKSVQERQIKCFVFFMLLNSVQNSDFTSILQMWRINCCLFKIAIINLGIYTYLSIAVVTFSDAHIAPSIPRSLFKLPLSPFAQPHWCMDSPSNPTWPDVPGPACICPVPGMKSVVSLRSPGSF